MFNLFGGKNKQVEALVSEGEALMENKQYQAAIACFTQALEHDHRHAAAYAGRAECKHWLKDYRGSVTDFDLAIRYNPKDWRAFMNRAGSHARLGDYERAIKDYDTAFRLSNSPIVFIDSSAMLMNQQRYQEAEALCTRGVEFVARHPQSLAPLHRGYLYNNRSMARRELGNYQAAIEDANIAMRCAPFLMPYFNRGLAYIELQRYDEALADAETMISGNPRSADGYRLYGDALHCLNRLKEAETAYIRALELRCVHRNYVLLMLGSVLQKQGDRAGALERYNEAISNSPRYARAYFLRGQVYAEQNDDYSALQDYNRALEIAPNYSNVFRYRAELHLRRMDYQAAINDAERYQKLYNGNWETLLVLAQAHDALGHPSDAKAFYQRYVNGAGAQANEKARQRLRELG
jgi:tetratricopeptide (TPR) repeat protein